MKSRAKEYNPENPATTLDELVQVIKIIGFYPEEIELLATLVSNNKTRDEFVKKLKSNS